MPGVSGGQEDNELSAAIRTQNRQMLQKQVFQKADLHRWSKEMRRAEMEKIKQMTNDQLASVRRGPGDPPINWVPVASRLVGRTPVDCEIRYL